MSTFIPPTSSPAAIAKRCYLKAATSLEEVKADVQRRSGALVGKTFELYLPIDTGDGTVDYLFTFRIIGETSKVQ